MTNAQIKKVENFLQEIEIGGNPITDLINVEEIDLDNPFESIRELIDDNNGFDVEIIYYSNAIRYLSENDPSLTDSLSLAAELGYDAGDLNSETLASLLASQEAREEYENQMEEIEEFFEELFG